MRHKITWPQAESRHRPPCALQRNLIADDWYSNKFTTTKPKARTIRPRRKDDHPGEARAVPDRRRLDLVSSCSSPGSRASASSRTTEAEGRFGSGRRPQAFEEIARYAIVPAVGTRMVKIDWRPG